MNNSPKELAKKLKHDHMVIFNELIKHSEERPVKVLLSIFVLATASWFVSLFWSGKDD